MKNLEIILETLKKKRSLYKKRIKLLELEKDVLECQYENLLDDIDKLKNKLWKKESVNILWVMQ